MVRAKLFNEVLKKIMIKPIRIVLCLAAVFVGTLFSSPVQAQLAITEVMSSAATNLGAVVVTQNSDFWELSNLGTKALTLTGYRFNDSDNLAAADPTPFEGLQIEGGESILFVQGSVNTNAESVRIWWGTNLNNTKIVFYTGHGFSSGGEGLYFWGPNEAPIDSVLFPEAARGKTFSYDPATGVFGVLSSNGVNGAFKAETTDDIGSPGRNTGPTPITFLQEPTNSVVNPGSTAIFSIQVQGRPRGTVQWYFGTNLIEGATGQTLVVSNAQSESSGFYHAVVNNGVTSARSKSGQLVLLTEISIPTFTKVPQDLMMNLGQSYTFLAEATGVPQPDIEWRLGNVLVESASGGVLPLSSVTQEQDGAYAVIARNQVGSVTNLFRVTVTSAPQLVITEVMSSALTNVAGHGDWWELSNLGTFPVSLRGYRFDDSSESLSAAFTFTNNVHIAPGESVIFTEGMTPEAFQEWWGVGNLPQSLKIITYRGNGLSSAGDAVNVWNAAASENSDKIASAVFSTATPGVSFGYNPDTGAFGALSENGVFGAFAAINGGDVGSPGYIRTPVVPIRPEILSAVKTASGFKVQWSSVAGKTYHLQARTALESGEWATIKTIVATGGATEEQDADSFPARYYRVFVQD